MRNRLVLTVPRELAGERLDVAVARLAPQISRRTARRLIGEGAVLVDGQRVRVQSRPLKAGAMVEVHDQTAPEQAAAVEPIGIVSLEPELIAVDKPPGMPTEPTRQGASGTLSLALTDQLRAQGEDASFLAAAHRLDTHTSGVVLFARSRAAAAALGAQFAAATVERRYLALVDGRPPFIGVRFDHALTKKADADGRVWAKTEEQGGVPALTLACVLALGATGALVWCAPRTGRTHQIRVHLADAGFPLVDDKRYGRPRGPSAHPGLHALSIGLVHPTTGRPIRYAAPPHATFLRACAERGIPEAAVVAATAVVAPEVL